MPRASASAYGPSTRSGNAPAATSAQYVALPAALAVPLPDAVSFEQGACLGIPVMTAHRCLFADGPVSGKTVLVTGGAGVVAHYAIQLRNGRRKGGDHGELAGQADHARAAART